MGESSTKNRIGFRAEANRPFRACESSNFRNEVSLRGGTRKRHVSCRHSQVGKGGLPSLFRFTLTTALLILLQTNVISQTRPADLVVINANIRTIVSKDSRAEAIAVSGNRITTVGSNKQIKKLIGPSTRIIDARGRLVLP